MRFTWLALCVVAAALNGFAQEEPSKLTARQLFFTARPASATPAEPPAPPPKPVVPVKKAIPKKQTTTAPPKQEPASEKAPTASQSVVIPYLGLRYSILQDMPDGQRQEVDPQKVFRSKEKFYLSLESNDTAYLYVVLQASQGTWEVLFPNADINHGNNRLNARSRVLVPSPANPFVFDETPGTEKLFIILSRQPETDLNEMIRSVQGNPSDRPTIPAKDFERVRGEMVLASRGIAIEGVKKAANAPSGETAVYLANTSATNDSRVVADIVLKHR